MSEALDWVKESLSDAVEDFENDDNCESIPLVPIMDYAVDAMENADFQETLRALGIAEPFDEQETYWRISADLSVSQLKKCIDMLQRAVDNTLNITETNTGGDAFNDDNSTEMNSSSRNDLIESDEEEQTSRLVTSISPRNPNKKMKNIIESDEEEEEINVSQPRTVRNAIESDEDDEAGPSVSSHKKNEDNDTKRSRVESDSDTEKPLRKRGRVISSDED
ncbi:hypothetical protein MTP99_014908 [Tenebrio molitor]|nr:hypothetical protein MTP99_014908 [Tenebrio molitor]